MQVHRCLYAADSGVPELMIAGTDFLMAHPSTVRNVCADLRGRVLADSEIDEIEAQCASDRAVCLMCDDGAVVIGLDPLGDGRFELFVWLAVAFRYGAFERQDAALQVIARDLGAEAIAFQARRKGWARRLGPEWHRRGNQFVRSVV